MAIATHQTSEVRSQRWAFAPASYEGGSRNCSYVAARKTNRSAPIC